MKVTDKEVKEYLENFDLPFSYYKFGNEQYPIEQLLKNFAKQCVDRETKQLKAENEGLDTHNQNQFEIATEIKHRLEAKEKQLEEVREYIDNQINHCKNHAKTYPVDKYSDEKTMSNEQMSGYYQGRGEANYAIKHLLTK